jgi:hypothetical protein
LQIRRSKSVITNTYKIILFSQLANSLNVNHFHSWVSGRFNPNHLCIRFECFLNLFEFSHINKIKLNIKFISSIHPHISLSTSIYIITCYYMITTFKYMKNSSCSSTTTSKSYTMFPIFNSGKTFLYCISSWISTSCIIKFSIRLSNIFLSICRSHMNWHNNTAVNWLGFATYMNS